MNVLVTGGAGFIGSHLVKRLLLEGCSVAVLDNFSSQVHGGHQELPSDMAGHVEVFRGDVRDPSLVSRAAANRDVVVHLAAETGTGQSMYEVSRYQDVNIGGTAVLLDFLVNQTNGCVSRIVVASSRAIYGEGKYSCSKHGIVYPGPRKWEHLQAGQFELYCRECNAKCTPEPTSEDSPIQPLSFYGLTKQVQEETVLMFARARGFSAYALRYQNVYGPGQSLQNPYTGILAIFSGLARTNSPIRIFEDGRESRDFVFIDDAVEATWRCIKKDQALVASLNVGTGRQTTVLEVARDIVQFFGSASEIRITGAYRQGDIRHNFADLSKIHDVLDFAPQVTLSEGLQRFLTWVSTQDSLPIDYELPIREMRERGIFHG